MISIQQNTNKDILAKLMATENITVIHKSVPTAYFDVKSRTLCCPVLKDDMSSELYDLFMGHEVSHALNTPAEGWHDKVSDKGMKYKGYLNVVEDVRIEKMIKGKYPGLRKSFYTGYNELATMDFFGTKGKDLQELNLIDRINLFYKIGSFSQIKFSDEEMVYIKRCDTLDTFEDVIKLADDLFDRQQKLTEDQVESLTQDQLMDLLDELGLEDDKDEQESSESLSVELEESDDEDENNSEASDANTDDATDSESSDENSNNETKSENSDENEGQEQTDDNGQEGGKGKTAEEKLLDEMTKSTTDESFRQNEETLVERDRYASEPVYHELDGRIKYENFIVSSKEIQENFDKVSEPYNPEIIGKTVKQFTEDNKKIISYMVKEFEMKKAAASYNRSWNAKSGELDMNKLAFYKLKEDIFNRVQVAPEGKSHGLVLTVDWSGSMSGTVRATIEQATLLSMFCRRLSIPFRLFAFSDSYHRVSDETIGVKGHYSDDNYYSNREKGMSEYYQKRTFGKVKYKTDGDYLDANWHLGDVSLLEIYNEKMSNSEFNKAMCNWFQLSSVLDGGYGSWNNYSGYDETKDYDTNAGYPSRLSLSGTPLDATLVLMRDYLVDFKRENNLDIVSLITLTDGASHSCFKGRNGHILDRAINKTFKLETSYTSRATHGLLNWIRETTGARTIGFYITQSNKNQIGYDAQAFCGTKMDIYTDEMDAKAKEFTKLSTSFTDGAYDLAILINQKKLKLDIEQDMIDVPEGANKGVLKRALVKAGTNKMQQRVILNQFVGQMAV